MRTKILKDNEGNFIPLAHSKSVQTSDNKILDDILEELKTDYDNKIHSSIKSRLLQDLGVIRNELRNANMLPYESQYISASNAYKGITDGNVVKGRTLQNLYDNQLKIITQETSPKYINIPSIMFKPNTKYRFIFYIKSNTLNNTENYGLRIATLEGAIFSNEVLFNKGEIGVKTYTLTSSQNITHDKFVFTVYGGSGSVEFDLVILEGEPTYIPPYFEGIKSVNEEGENLVEVSCGKNLFDGVWESGNILASDGTLTNDVNAIRSKNFMRVEPNTNYCISPFNGIERVWFYDSNKKYISTIGIQTFVTPLNARYIKTRVTTTNLQHIFQIEEGTVATTYEPYTEHRLPIKMKNLRGINGVYDTSDGVRRIYKYVVTGNEPTYTLATVDTPNHTRVNLTNLIPRNPLNNSAVVCSHLKPRTDTHGDYEYIVGGSIDSVYIQLANSKLISNNVDGIKDYLRKEYNKGTPLTFYYILATPTTEEGNVEDIKTWNDKTNVFTEGSLIEPNISCKIPTNVQTFVMSLQEENEALKEESTNNNLNNLETNVNQEARLTALELGVMY